MATVVIIHAAEDTLPARALAEKLRGAKLTVVLERPPGEELREAVKGAPVTIALWSPRSIAQSALVDEVQFARGKSKLVHARMQSAPMPEPFRNEQAVDLTGWRGEDDFAPWRDLAKLVTSKAGVPNLPPPTPKPPSGFFQPGVVQPSAQQQQQQPQPPAGRQARPQQQQPRPQPQPRPAAASAPRAPQAASAPKSGGGRGMLIAIIAVVVVAIAGGGGYWFMTQNGAQATSLEDVDLGSASAIREFLRGDPPASAREEAEEALAALEQQQFDAARDANTIQAFEEFLRDFPESEQAVFVQGQIAQLRLREAETAQQTPAATDPIPPSEPANQDLNPPTAPSPSNAPTDLTPPPSEPETQEPDDAPTQ
mgnify:CR=1 FL=1